MSLTPPGQPRPLADLLPAGAEGFAVVNLETTGSGQLCRIVEIALLLLSPEGEIEQDWSTVINPGIPIPNAAVHGIDERLTAAPPSFAAVAPTLAVLLEGRVLGDDTATQEGLCQPSAEQRRRQLQTLRFSCKASAFARIREGQLMLPLDQIRTDASFLLSSRGRRWRPDSKALDGRGWPGCSCVAHWMKA